MKLHFVHRPYFTRARLYFPWYGPIFVRPIVLWCICICYTWLSWQVHTEIEKKLVSICIYTFSFYTRFCCAVWQRRLWILVFVPPSIQGTKDPQNMPVLCCLWCPLLADPWLSSCLYLFAVFAIIPASK